MYLDVKHKQTADNHLLTALHQKQLNQFSQDPFQQKSQVKLINKQALNSSLLTTHSRNAKQNMNNSVLYQSEGVGGEYIKYIPGGSQGEQRIGGSKRELHMLQGQNDGESFSSNDKELLSKRLNFMFSKNFRKADRTQLVKQNETVNLKQRFNSLVSQNHVTRAPPSVVSNFSTDTSAVNVNETRPHKIRRDREQNGNEISLRKNKYASQEGLLPELSLDLKMAQRSIKNIDSSTVNKKLRRNDFDSANQIIKESHLLTSTDQNSDYISIKGGDDLTMATSLANLKYSKVPSIDSKRANIV